MISNAIGIALLIAAALWFVRGWRTVNVPKGSIGSNAEMNRLANHYSLPCVLMGAAGIAVLAFT